MKAFLIRRYGGPNVLEQGEFPEPEPGPGELLIEVHAASVNPIDWKLRAGMVKPVLPYRLPVVLGHDLSGVVLAVGPGVQRFSPGDSVFARMDDLHIGAFAERAVVAERMCAPKPKSLSHVEAASLPLVGLTAYQALFEAGELREGQRVLIHGGSGGVGSLAVQLAKAHGVQVVSTASARNVEHVRELGASEVIDYTSQRFEDHVRDVDVVLDTVGGDTLMRSFACVRKGGKVVSLSGPPTPEFAKSFGLALPVRLALWFMSGSARRAAKRHGVSYEYVWMRPDGEQLGGLGDAVDKGELRVQVDRVFPFAETREALAHAESGKARGKVVVAVKPQDA